MADSEMKKRNAANVDTLAEKAAKAKAAKEALKKAQEDADKAQTEYLEAQVEADAEYAANDITAAIFNDKEIKALNKDVKRATRKPVAKKEKKKTVVLPTTYSVAPGTDPAVSYIGEDSFEETVKKFPINLTKHVFIPNHEVMFSKSGCSVRAAVQSFIIDKNAGTAVLVWQNGERTFDRVVTRHNGTVDELATVVKMVAKYSCGNSASANSVLFNMANLAEYTDDAENTEAISRHREAKAKARERGRR